jgi:hypothetical protein
MIAWVTPVSKISCLELLVSDSDRSKSHLQIVVPEHSICKVALPFAAGRALAET